MRLFIDARRRKTNCVLVWRLDRFARSTKDFINALEEFCILGADFISFKENIDTSTRAGKVLFTMISAFSEFEREIICSNVSLESIYELLGGCSVRMKKKAMRITILLDYIKTGQCSTKYYSKTNLYLSNT